MKRIIVSVMLLAVAVVPQHLHAAPPSRDAARTTQLRPAATTPAAGRTPGTFRVTNGGAATYSVPLATPPGIGNAQPALSLAYNSQAGDALAGYGADLGGLPVISRTRAIFAVDGFAGGLNYDANDRFAFSGQRLINTSGAYGADGTTYHTEIEHWTVTVSHGQCGAGPCWFSATAKDGTRYELGNSTDSRILAVGRADVRVWAMNKMTDANGNVLTVTYTQTPADCVSGAAIQSPGGYYPLQIDYSSNAAAGVSVNRSVQFGYVTRGNPEVQYQGGAVVTTAAALCSMTSTTNGIVASNYRFTYAQAPVTNRTRLSSLQRCDSAAANANCLTPTTFQWQNAAGAFTGSSAATNDFTFSSGWTPAQNYPRTVADVNGDGRADLVGFRNGVRVSLAVQGQTAYGPTSTWSPAFGFDGRTWQDSGTTPRYAADLNGDGLADIVGFATDGVHFAYSTGSGFTTEQVIPGLFTFQTSLFPKLVADVNGDGLADLLCLKGGVQVALSTGTGFKAPATWIDDFSYDAGGWSAQAPRVLGDVNGDSRADVIGFSNTGVVVGLSTGTSFVKSWPSYPYFGFNSWDPSFFPRTMADVNGDGLADIVGFKSGVQVGLSTGAGFLPPATWINDFSFDGQGWQVTMPRYLADVNGDLLPDIVGFGLTINRQPAVKVALSTGTSFSEASWNNGSLTAFGENSSTWTPGGNPAVVTDANGDGLMDVIAFGQFSVWTGTSAGPFPDLATAITDGLGGKHSVTYQPISNSTIYSPAAPQAGTAPARAHQLLPVPSNTAISVFPTQNVQGGRFYVVTTALASNDPAINPGGAYSNTSNYTYGGALIDLSGRGWLGFQTVSKVSPSGRKTVTTLNQLFPLTGTVQGVQLLCGSSSDPLCTSAGVVLENRAFAWYDCSKTTGCNAPATNCQPYPNVRQVLQSSARTDFFTYGTYEYSRGKTYCYDGYGNPTRTSDLGYVDRQGRNLSTADDLYTYSGYRNDAAANRFGLLQWRRTTANASTPAPVSCAASPSFAAGDYGVRAMEYDGNANPTRTCAWDDKNTRWSARSFTYDRFGNRLTSTDTAGNVTTRTFDAVYHAFRATEVSPPNAAGVVLTRYFGYDPRFGVLVARTDANCNPATPAACNVTVFTTDGFGRATGRQGAVPAIAGVVASTNNVTPFVTGTLPFAKAAVVTLTSSSWVGDRTGIRLSTVSTQTWPAQTPARTASAFRQFDAKGRPYKLGIAGPASPVALCTKFTSSGEVQARSVPFLGSATTDCSAATLWYTTARDVYRRHTAVTRPAGPDGSQTAKTSIAFPTRRTTVFSYASGSPLSYTRTLTYDYFGSQRRPVTMALQQASPTAFAYDGIGRLVKVTEPATTDNPNGVVNSFVYDALGRLVEQQDPNRGKWIHGFGTNGKVATITDALGKQTRYAYDALLRPTGRSVSGGPSIAYSYDSTTCANGLGRLASTTASGQAMEVSRTFCYDRYGNITTSTATLGTQSFTSSAIYDPRNRAIASTFPDGSTVTRTYAGCCSLQSVSLGGAPYAVYSGFNALNVATTEQYGNGVVNSYGYSPTGELTAYSSVDKNGAPIFRYSVAWDLLSRVTGVTDVLAAPAAGTSETYKYAPPARMVSAEAPGTYGTQTFEWDALGNRTVVNGVIYQYSGHAPVSAKGFTARYDANGNLTVKELAGVVTTYGYDGANNLVTVQLPGRSPVQFVYDAGGGRVRRIDSDGTVTLFPFPDYQVTGTAAPSAVRYVDGARATVAAVAPSGPSYVHTNQVFSTVGTTDTTGLAANGKRILYLPFGGVFTSAASGPLDRMFTQRDLDSASALYYFGKRYYDPGLGTFLSPDANLGAAQTQPGAYNRYAYGLGNPASVIDPTGASAASVTACVFFLAGNMAWTASAATGEVNTVSLQLNFAAGALNVVGAIASCAQTYRDWSAARAPNGGGPDGGGPGGGGPGGGGPPGGNDGGGNDEDRANDDDDGPGEDDSLHIIDDDGPPVGVNNAEPVQNVPPNDSASSSPDPPQPEEPELPGSQEIEAELPVGETGPADAVGSSLDAGLPEGGLAGDASLGVTAGSTVSGFEASTAVTSGTEVGTSVGVDVGVEVGVTAGEIGADDLVFILLIPIGV